MIYKKLQLFSFEPFTNVIEEESLNVSWS